MIISSEKRTILKDRIQNRTKTRINQEQLNELGVPRIFHYIHVGDHGYSYKKEVESTIQFTRYGDGYVKDYSRQEKKEIKIKTGGVVGINAYSSGAIRGCPIVFTAKDPTINPTRYYQFAGFNPECNYLIVSGAIVNATEAEEYLAKDVMEALKEIFKYIKKGGFKPLQRQANSKRLMMGCDPEFSLARGNDRIPASELLRGGTSAPLGTDGASHTGELRPSPAYQPLDLVNRGIKPLLKQLLGVLPEDVKATTGGGFQDPLGDHIHFNKKLTDEEVRLLDDFVGIPCTKMKGGTRAGGSYGQPGDVRSQPHGVEYRTCPSTLIPGLLEAKYVTAYCVILKWERMKVGQTFTYQVDSSGIPTREDYINLAPTNRYKQYLNSYFEWVKHGEIDTRGDFLSLWFERRGGSSKAKKFRAIITDKPEWLPKIKRVSVKGLTENKKIIIDSYGPSFIREEDNIPKGAVIIGVPPEKFTSLEADAEEAQDFFLLISDLLNSHVAVQISSKNSVEIRFPHTWREKKRALLTAQAIKKIIRESLTP